MARGSGRKRRGRDHGTRKAIFERRAEFSMWEYGSYPASPISTTGSIRLNPDINKTAAALIAQLSPTVARAFNDHFVPYALEEYELWPVKTGHSRGLLDVEYRTRDGGAELSASLISGAVYTRWIWRGQLVRDMYDAGKEAADRIADQLMEGLI